MIGLLLFVALLALLFTAPVALMYVATKWAFSRCSPYD